MDETKNEDGGSAFPVVTNEDNGYIEANGMTLRDWFAGQALIAMANNCVEGPHNAGFGTSDALSIAADAYSLADAMLKARSR